MIGKQILNYEIKSLIGEGGMGNVYQGEHQSIGRKVAIKVLRPELARSAEIRSRFKNEAKIMASLQHPGIVGLYDYHEDESGLYLIMEYVEGGELADKIKRLNEPMNIEDAKNIMIQILEAFDYAHKNDIVHRDVKPANIIIDKKGKVKVLDFGIAKILGNEQFNLTKDGNQVGTPFYMSPEQVKAKEVDLRSDIYSLGVTFYEMLAGFCPYKELSSEYEISSKIVNDPLVSLVDSMGDSYRDVWGVVSRATEKSVNDRFQTCAEMIDELKGENNIIKQQVLPKKKYNDSKPKKKSIIFLIGGVVLVIGIVAFVLINNAKSEKLKDEENYEVLHKNSDESDVRDDNDALLTPYLSASSSSNIPSSGGLSYVASNAIDDNLFTWWSPKGKQSGTKWLQLDLGANFQVSGLNIHAGSHFPDYNSNGKSFGNLFYKNWRIRRAKIEFSNGTSITINLSDLDAIQNVRFNSSVNTRFIKIIPLDYYDQFDGWNDYCISELSPIIAQ